MWSRGVEGSLASVKASGDGEKLGDGLDVDGFAVAVQGIPFGEGDDMEVVAVELRGGLEKGIDFALTGFGVGEVIRDLDEAEWALVAGENEIDFAAVFPVVELKILLEVVAVEFEEDEILHAPPRVFARIGGSREGGDEAQVDCVGLFLLAPVKRFE